MIRLGLRLTFTGREAIIRLVLIAAAVALGSSLLLITLAGINGVNIQNDRYAWLSTGATAREADLSGHDPLWWLLSADRFDGQLIGRIDLAATGLSSPVPPGIPHLPGSGQYYASPALAALLRDTPASELADRFGGREAGVIGDSALPGPDALLIIVGHSAGELSHLPGAMTVTSIDTTPPSGCDGADCGVGVGIDASGIDLIFSVVALALLVPVLIFIGTATRLSAARREQRFAVMRLVGATPRQVSVISAIEACLAAAAGVAVGFGLFFVLRPPIASIPWTGAPFFAGDLRLSPADIGLVAIGVPLSAAVAALIALRRVRISPLGISRRVTPSPPRARRLIPLLAGLAELTVFTVIGTPKGSGSQTFAYLPGFLLIMAGLIITGPWLTMTGSRFMVRRAGRVAPLIAARRLGDNPKAAFRAVSGLILGMFVTSVAVAMITTIDANRGLASGGPDDTSTLAEVLQAGPSPALSPIPVPAGVLGRLTAIPGVTGVTPLREQSASLSITLHNGFRVHAALASCADLARTPGLGRCPAGAQAAAVPASPAGLVNSSPSDVRTAVAISSRRLARLPGLGVIISTNGSTAAIERTRTVLELAYPAAGAPRTLSEMRAGINQNLGQWQRLADIVILVSLPIAGCALAASVAGGLTDRKR
ncbi:MAG TPA: FtsX-like permease family protein, partial [Streptosporangiaceae bacterium]